jgi:hypothetical protein
MAVGVERYLMAAYITHKIGLMINLEVTITYIFEIFMGLLRGRSK